jgi:hypothetical protein
MKKKAQETSNGLKKLWAAVSHFAQFVAGGASVAYYYDNNTEFLGIAVGITGAIVLVDAVVRFAKLYDRGA